MSIQQIQPLYLIVGEQRVSPFDHQTYRRFKLWVASTFGRGNIETFDQENITIEHWDEQAADPYPNLLNPCECGAFLPMEVDPGPMLSSAIGLLSDMTALKCHYDKMKPAFQNIIDQLCVMAELSIDTNTTLEIR